jgi:hypothetical protein
MTKQYINLIEIGNTGKNRSAFRKELFRQIGDDLYEYSTFQELLYHALKRISPINKTIKNTELSIEKACKKADIHLHFTYLVNKSDPKFSYASAFSKNILQIETLPREHYKKLLADANNDLRTITELIKWYEGKQTFLRSTQQNMINDFYKRCLNARDEILDYIIYKIKNKALLEAQPKLASGFQNIIDLHKKFIWPYEFRRPYFEHYYDCRKLDKVGHRIQNYTMETGEEMEELYNLNKLKFYKKYFKDNSIDSIFSEIKNYLSNLPLSNKRDEIFKELNKTFKEKRWLSFYALALPQVEGLFAEMNDAVNSKNDLSKKGLSEKVSNIRKFHYLSVYHFDYFEYHIPTLRNSFAHTGYVEDVQTKSYDLLVDICFVLQVFYGLKNPLVEVTKLHKLKRPDNFVSVGNYALYFSLLNDIKRIGHYKKIEKEVIAFEKDFLFTNCSIETPVYYLLQNIDNKIKDLIDRTSSLRGFEHEELNLEKINKPQIENFILSEKKKESLRMIFNSRIYDVDFLCDCHIYLNNYETYLPSLTNELKTKLKITLKKNKKILNNIVEIKNQTNSK